MIDQTTLGIKIVRLQRQEQYLAITIILQSQVSTGIVCFLERTREMDARFLT